MLKVSANQMDYAAATSLYSRSLGLLKTAIGKALRRIEGNRIMANDSSDFARSMSIATSGLRAQAGRMRVISENIANADSTAQTAGGDPYRRKVPTFSSALDRTLDAQGRDARQDQARPVGISASSTSRAIRRRMRPATSNIPTSIRWSK